MTDFAFAALPHRPAPLDPDLDVDPRPLAPLQFVEPPRAGTSPLLQRAQPLIDDHWRRHTPEPMAINARTHLGNEVARTMRLPLAADLSESSHEEVQHRVRTEDLFGGRMSDEAHDARDAVVDQIVALGGERPSVRVLPLVVDAGGGDGAPHAVCVPLFEVSTGRGRAPAYVDLAGQRYDSLDDLLASRTVPHDGSPVVLDDGSAGPYVLTPAPPSFFDEPTLQGAAIGVGAVGTLLSLTGSGAPIGVPLAMAGTYLAGGVVDRLGERASRGGTLDPRRDPALWWDYGGLALAGAVARRRGWRASVRRSRAMRSLRSPPRTWRRPAPTERGSRGDGTNCPGSSASRSWVLQAST